MDKIEVTQIHDYSRRTLRELAGRLQDSRSLEELAYREAELGETWSLVDGDRCEAERRVDSASHGEALQALQSGLVEVYCLLTRQDDGLAAASVLRQIVLDCAALQSVSAT